jgi:hypothetical protein
MRRQLTECWAIVPRQISEAYGVLKTFCLGMTACLCLSLVVC